MILMGDKLDIILFQGKIRYEHWERHTVLSTGRNVANAAATEQVASLLGCKKYLVEEVWRGYVNGKPLSVANTKGNYRLKSTRVPTISFFDTIVHHFFL